MKNEGVEVKKYKLTKPQLAFQKQYGQLAKLGRFLQAKMQTVAQEGASLSEMMRQVDQELTGLLEQAPADPTRELVGQPGQ